MAELWMPYGLDEITVGGVPAGRIMSQLTPAKAVIGARAHRAYVQGAERDRRRPNSKQPIVEVQAFP
jgi:hypothetical protein